MVFLFGFCRVEFENVRNLGDSNVSCRVAALDYALHSRDLETVDNYVKHSLGRLGVVALCADERNAAPEFLGERFADLVGIFGDDEGGF